MSVGVKLISLRELCNHLCTRISHLCYQRGLQCDTGMPFTIDMAPSRRHLVES